MKNDNLKTPKQLTKVYINLIKKAPQNRLFCEIPRYKRIIEIINGINPIEKSK